MIIWGDYPEYVSYVDYYNSIDEANSASFRYVDPIFPEEIAKRDAPDVIIARHISYHDAKRAMRALAPSTIAADEENYFYDNLFPAGMLGRRQRIVPLSFNIPILVFDREQEITTSHPHSITMSELQREAERLNRRDEARIARIGFSPIWDGHFLYVGTKIYGADYHENSQGMARWDESAIFAALRYLRSWNSGLDAAEFANFTDRYIRHSLYTRIAEDRIGFLASTIAEFAMLSPEIGQEFQFRAIIDAGTTRIDENITFIGIHRHAKNDLGARNFVEWMLQRETQEALIAHTVEYNINIFGIAQGLSTIRDVTSQTIPRHYPALIGTIPDISLTPSPSPLPKNWHRIRAEVIEAWLQNFFNGIDQESIENEIAKWQKRANF